MKTFLFLIALINLIPTLSFGAETRTQTSYASGTNSVTEVISDRMEANLEKNEATFTGNVQVKDPTFIMKSNEMIVYFDSTTNGIERIYAKGNVTIDQKNKKAASQEATYYVKEARIVLKGNPKVHEEGKTLTGETITFYRNTQKTQVEGKTTLILTDPSLLKPSDKSRSTNN